MNTYLPDEMIRLHIAERRREADQARLVRAAIGAGATPPRRTLDWWLGRLGLKADAIGTPRVA